MDSSDKMHFVKGRLLRPEEQSSGQFVVNGVLESMNEMVIQKNTTSATEPHQIIGGKIVDTPVQSQLDKDIEKIYEANGRIVESLMASVCEDFEEGKFRQLFQMTEREWDRLIPQINEENNKKYGHVKKMYHDHYNMRHLGWIEKNEEEMKEDLNIGAVMPCDSRQWNEEQRKELFSKKELYAYIEDPEDFWKFDSYLKDICPSYKNGILPENDQENCPCIESTILTNGKKVRTPLHVAVASNFYQFLYNLTVLAQENTHAQWLVYRWLFPITNNYGKFMPEEECFNIFVEIMILSKPSDNLTKTWDIFFSKATPFAHLTTSSSFVDSLYTCNSRARIYTPENLSCSYQDSLISCLIANGHFPQAYELFTCYLNYVGKELIHGLLVELVCSGYKWCIDLFLKDILQWAKLDRYNAILTRELIFPKKIKERNPDSVIHAAIRKGNLNILSDALSLVRTIYTERRCLNLEENEADDLEKLINVDDLNPMEFAIEQSQMVMVELLKKFGMKDDARYNYFNNYTDLMNGCPDNFIDHCLINGLPEGDLLTLAVTLERSDLAQLLLVKYTQSVNFETFQRFNDDQVNDINNALLSALYPRARNLYNINSRSIICDSTNMENTIAMLLIAGATLEDFSWYRGINSLSEHIPTHIIHLLASVFQARQENVFPIRFCYLQDAYHNVYLHFGISRLEET